MKRFSAVLTFSAIVLTGAMMILNFSGVSDAVSAALEGCLYRIIPSLFGMTVLASALSKSGVLPYLLRKTRVDGGILSAFILGNVGGYPIGAKLLSDCVDGGLDKKTAETAVCFCYSAGPAFAAGIVGAGVFGDIRLGLTALFSVFLSNLTFYCVFLLCHKSEKTVLSATFRPFSTQLMMDCVTSAGYSMISVSSVIMFFAALKAILKSMLPGLFSGIFGVMLEITGVSNMKPSDGITVPIAAALLSFGGVCVICQITAIIGGRFSLKKFLISRFPAAALSYLYANILLKILAHLGLSFTASTRLRLTESPSPLPVICVFAMLLITLIGRRTEGRHVNIQ